MEARVKLISRETIKPSSKTPQHLKDLKLSYLDQLAPPVYFPVIFFYQADESRGLTASNHLQISQYLKNSLSHTLPSFYPLAGRIKATSLVDCNDEGVEFIVARVQAQLIEAIQNPNMEDLKQYLPLDPTNHNNGNETRPLLVVQVNFFDCGGIAVGVCFSHEIADCTSIMAFINAWTATCRGEADDRIPRFSFDLCDYFPAKEFPRSGFPWSDENFATKRFVFDKEKLLLLKEAATSSSRSVVKDPTRVELVSAFIWESFLKVANINKLRAKKSFAAFHVVNLRPRKKPPRLLENVFGNCTMLAFAVASDEYEGVEEFQDLVGKLRSSIRTISDEYITEAQSGDVYLNEHKKLFSQLSKGELERCSFSSWCRFPVYDVDYGWGKPVWLCTTTFPTKNLTVLVNSRCGEGIEAWVNMNKDNLEMLETQIKLISADVKDKKS